MCKNVDLLAEMIQEHDEPILKHLTDIRVNFTEAQLDVSDGTRSGRGRYGRAPGRDIGVGRESRLGFQWRGVVHVRYIGVYERRFITVWCLCDISVKFKPFMTVQSHGNLRVSDDVSDVLRSLTVLCVLCRASRWNSTFHRTTFSQTQC